MKRMVIKGSEWHRGGIIRMGDSPALLTKGGKRCCVGIHGRLCNIPDDHIKDVGWPDMMTKEHVTECYSPWVANEELFRASTINDHSDTTDEQKIAKLRPIFAEIGVSIVWRPDL